MTWTLYRWTWRVKSPLYISMPPAGVLTRCRLYVPAYTLWGAVTNELGKREVELPSGNKFEPAKVRQYYEEVGKYLKEKTRFSYLYPAEPVDGNWKTWLPRYQEGQGLSWLREDQLDKPDNKGYSHRTFRSQLLYTRLNTAIERKTGTASDETLHETECLQPFWRSNKKNAGKPVAMVGYIFVKDNNLLTELEKINNLFVGADTRYGLGHLCRETDLEKCQQLFDLAVELNGEDKVVVNACPYVLGHIKNNHPLVGELEMMRRWTVSKIEENEPNCYWSPGSYLWQDGKKNFVIEELGNWELYCNTKHE